MSALTDVDDHQPKRLHEWNLPTDAGDFLAWLKASGTPGATDAERLATFDKYPAAADMPDQLRQDLALLLAG